ncbi:MAG: four helix bundle protein [Bacteroidaceae bacterium]|nr:four helix bundle protein [Bacteroidaceae bacterium]
MSRNIENIRVWQDARLFVNKIYAMMADVKDFGFRDQIQRAAVSIMNNIAEGSESGSDQLFCKYLNIAKGSCSEVKSMLYLCSDLNYCTEAKKEDMLKELLSVTGQLYRLIEVLQQPNKKQ